MFFLLTAFTLFGVSVGLVNFTTTSLSPPDFNNTLMNITFSDPQASDCGLSTTTQNESVTMVVRTGNAPTCLDLDYVFTHPAQNHATPSGFSEYDGVAYSLSSPAGTVGWSPEVFNYSQVFYTQHRVDTAEEEDPSRSGYLVLKAFNESGCPGNGMNESASRWYSWSCANEDGVCSTLPYSIKSILISGPELNTRPGDKGCVEAVMYNSGIKADGNAALGIGLLVSFATCLML